MWEKRNIQTLAILLRLIILGSILVVVYTTFKREKTSVVLPPIDPTITELGWCRVLDVGEIPGTEIGFYKVAVTDDWKDNLAVRYCFVDRRSIPTNDYTRVNLKKKCREVFVFTKTFHQIDKQPFFVLKDAIRLRAESQ